MITIKDCLEGKVKSTDLHLGWILSVKDKYLQLSYNFREFSWKSVQTASDIEVNRFLQTDIYKNMRSRLMNARRKRKTLFYQANNISDLKYFLDLDKVKINLDKLIQAKFEQMKNAAQIKV